ncbi:condensation domain-containing protein [Nonomuraea sp. NPDC050310]|uniref:condensation domain-containing protein n=1 Tax=Nonomuraea sp. NPDC050310 TaxID=3154935 RepID=UPI003401A3C4
MIEASPAQRGMWVTEQLTEAGSAYHVPLVVRFSAGLDAPALLRACAAVARRHPALSAAIREEGERLVLTPGAPPLVEQVDAELDEGAVRRPFDLERGPLARFTLYRDALLFVAHHLVFDGFSKEILLRELAGRYREELLVSQAAAYWAEHWREPGETMVAGVPLKARHAGPARVVEFTVAPDVPGLSRFEVLLAGLHVLLRGYGNAEVVTAIDLSTRTPETSGEIGTFVSELPVASVPGPGQSFAEFGRELHDRLREVYRFRAVPLAAAVPHLRPHAALTPVSVSFRGRSEPDPVFEGVEAEVDWAVFNHAVRGAVHLQCVDGPGGVRVSLRHLPEVDGPRLAADLSGLLERVVGEPGVLLGDLVAFDTVDTVDTVGTVTSGVAASAAPAAAPAPAGSELTEQVRQIWEEVLGLSPVLDDDDLFDLGGHSLTITQIIARMERRLGLKVELDDFFDNPTIAGVMGTISRAD